MASYDKDVEDGLQVLQILKLDVMVRIFKYALDKALAEGDMDSYGKLSGQIPLTAVEMMDELIHQEVVEGEEESYKLEEFSHEIMYEKEVGEAFQVLESAGLGAMVRVFKFGLNDALKKYDFAKHNRISAQILKTTMKMIKTAKSMEPNEENPQ